MLKIVPDPPYVTEAPDDLEDTLVEAMESTLCGLAVANQSITFLPKSPATIMLLSVMHELDAVRSLLEYALAQVQLKSRTQPLSLH
ncbi:TPA: hypothetical protein SMR47_004080 [Pseudomonas putida]|uniref:hypothetical protein n=1 Tax=unclassified Pseudomonas TaxID=196821 RepID=UPI0006D42120|nr:MULTISPECIES: hypothetical protein [unclassified Pseudomonas]HEK1770114.1 hypothetical protein [Pseudomonas putida]